MIKGSTSEGGGSGPVRFRIAFSKPESLLGEFTKSVNRGCVVLSVLSPVPVGTRFVFELVTPGVPKPVEVDGEVLSVQPGPDGKHQLNVSYELGRRGGLDEVVFRVLESQRSEWVRKSPRVPLNLRATEDAPGSPGYRVRDLSLGGAGLEIESSEVPAKVSLGAPILLEMAMRDGGQLRLRGVVAWVTSASGAGGLVNSRFGVQFVDDLDLESLEMLDKVVSLKSIPRAALVSFGAKAFADDA